MTNVILDTNIFIRSLLGSSSASFIIDEVIPNKKFTLVVSDNLIKEIKRSAAKARLAPLIPSYKLVKLISLIKERAVSVKISDNLKACRDVKDNFLLEMAVKARAHIIVTEDKDLLVLNPFRNIAIITPAEFLKRLGWS